MGNAAVCSHKNKGYITGSMNAFEWEDLQQIICAQSLALLTGICCVSLSRRVTLTFMQAQDSMLCSRPMPVGLQGKKLLSACIIPKPQLRYWPSFSHSGKRDDLSFGSLCISDQTPTVPATCASISFACLYMLPVIMLPSDRLAPLPKHRLAPLGCHHIGLHPCQCMPSFTYLISSSYYTI